MALQPERILVDLARFLLRAVSQRPGEVQVEHIRSEEIEFLFLRLPGGGGLSARDQAALVSVLETVGARSGRTVIVDWR